MEKNGEKRDYHAVSFSGGKDSTAMLLMMIEKRMPIDGVFWADTGMEFPEMYRHVERVDAYLFRERGIHIQVLRNPRGFEWLMFEEPKKRKSAVEQRIQAGVSLYGNGWPGIRKRWCTGQLKTKLITEEVKRLKGDYNAISYIGIAYDEQERCKGEHYPLVEWKVTEEEALQYCYEKGFDWDGLYEIYHRCSCWCCPFQRIDELRKLRKHHPKLWERLLEMDERALKQFGNTVLGSFRKGWTVKALDERFAMEEKKALEK